MLTPFTPCHTAPPTAYMLVSLCTRARCAWGREAYAHGECTAKVIEDDPGTRVARMIHGKICAGGRREIAGMVRGRYAMGEGVESGGRDGDGDDCLHDFSQYPALH
jgi:hypothetical protein